MTSTLIFFGSDRFSAVVLSELIKQNHAPNLVVTDQPKPKDKRGLVVPNKVEKIASEQNIKVLYYQANNEELINYITTHYSIGLSASFPHLFPPEFIKLFENNLYNLHPSLLPQYRNVAPGPYAIALGDTETGITLQHIDEQIDHGSIVAQVKDPILPTDNTTTLLTRLFIHGTNIFIRHLTHGFTDSRINGFTDKLVFTRRLTRESGYLEWDVVQKLLQGYTLKAGDTKNPLINLRLTHHPDRTSNILPDLIRALDTYEKVWTIAPTRKGDLPISFTLPPNHVPSTTYYVLVPGKPRPIPYTDFARYYL